MFLNISKLAHAGESRTVSPGCAYRVHRILEDLRVFKGKAGRDIRNAGDVAVLLNAMKTEKDLVEFYEKFSHNIKDMNGKKFFLKLADWERTHYQLLEGIYESITFFRMQS